MVDGCSLVGLHVKNKIMEKEDLIEQIVDDLKENLFESEEYIFDLVREALRTRTIKELKEINA
jgi:hypothetical protein